MQLAEGPRFVKGHGTENDFVLLPDLAGELDLTTRRVRALCDRRAGIGGDGVLRVVRAAAVPDAPQDVPGDAWFMDYRNADGSLAEMCGNGVRVFARYLAVAGLVTPGEVAVGTRAGVRRVMVHSTGDVTVDMGLAKVLESSTALLGGISYPGIAVHVGNPHLACVLDDALDALDLSVAPGYNAQLFPHGVNVEFVQRLDSHAVRMRVFERGVGETRSCGTGTVAAAVAALRADGTSEGEQSVQLPGGVVQVRVSAETAMLTGPAVLVGWGRVSGALWEEEVDP